MIEKTSLLTRPDEIKGSVEIVFIHITHHWHSLVSDLFVGAKDNKKKPMVYIALDLSNSSNQIHIPRVRGGNL
jgi:hypothetical protein